MGVSSQALPRHGPAGRKFFKTRILRVMEAGTLSCRPVGQRARPAMDHFNLFQPAKGMVWPFQSILTPELARLHSRSWISNSLAATAMVTSFGRLSPMAD